MTAAPLCYIHTTCEMLVDNVTGIVPPPNVILEWHPMTDTLHRISHQVDCILMTQVEIEARSGLPHEENAHIHNIHFVTCSTLMSSAAVVCHSII